MARIEPLPPQQSSRSSNLRKIAKPLWWIVRLPFKITFRFLVFALIVFIVVEIVRTGLWHIRYVSDILYRQPMPVREVKASPFSTDLLLFQAEESIAEHSFRPSLKLQEGQITALLQSSLHKESLQPFGMGQLAIQREYMQFFGNLKSNPRVYITANVVPEVKNSHINLKITQLKVGNVRLPQAFVSAAMLDVISTFVLRAGLEKIRVDSVTLEVGTMNLQSISL